MPSWLVYSLVPSRAGLWMAHEASRWLYQDLGQHWEVISGSILRRRYRDIGANSPCDKIEERRVHQIVCEKVSEYGTLMSEWHDTVYTGRDLPPQSVNCTPGSNRSSQMSHLKAVGATRRASREDHYRGHGWRKGHKLRLDKSTLRASESYSQPKRRDTIVTEVDCKMKVIRITV